MQDPNDGLRTSPGVREIIAIKLSLKNITLYAQINKI